MREPSPSPYPSPSAAGDPESDPPAPLRELIQLYQTEHALLLKHQAEVERRRAAVRAAAVQEASEILLSARQEMRRVLVQTRRELVALAAQLRAVGCEPALGRSIGDDDFQGSVARDVRNVLRDARSELSDIARDAGDLCTVNGGTRLLAPPTVVTAALPEPSIAPAFSSDRTQGPSGDTADDSSEQVPAPGPVAQLAAHWRAVAMVLVAVAVVATVFVSVRSSPGSEAVVATPEPEAAESATKGAAPAPNASMASNDPSEKPGSGMLSLSLEVQRPSWLRINVDGEADLGRTYQQGESRTIQATREIQLRAGDAGAVLVSLGGGAPVPLGPDGQVRTRRFAREGAPAVDQAGRTPTATQGSEVRPLAQGVAAGTEPNEPLSATATHGTAVQKYATEQPERAATTPEHTAAAEREILERHQRWFDAFERGDRPTMASLASNNFSLVDQRPERARGASGRVERTIQDLRVQVTAGIGAVLSGRIAETTTVDDAPATTVAMLSEVWIRRGEEWQLVSVRMVPLNAVPATLQ
jgi:hypothetical protein